MFNENTFTESYARIFGTKIKIDEKGNQFFDVFYRRFSASHTDIAKAFKDSDMEKQKNNLKKSLLYGVNFIENSNSLDYMHKIAVSHNKQHYNIKPEFYDLWMDCMIETVREFDSNFCDDIELAWRLAFAPCITYMKFMYHR